MAQPGAPKTEVYSSDSPEPTPADIVQLAQFIHQKTGIVLGDNKSALIRARLSRRLRDLNLKTYAEYYAYLQSHEDRAVELIRMIDAITTNLTFFFRENEHFDFLRSFLPGRSQNSIRILSAGCSTGEEPYTIAICAREVFGGRAASRVEIQAADISSRAVARAKLGVYKMDDARDISRERLRAFFLRGTGPNEGLIKVAPEIQELVTVQRMNLFESLPSGSFDVIFCRNMAMYFDQPGRQRLASRIHDALVPEGVAIFGHSEGMMAQGQSRFAYVQPSVYVKRDPGRLPAGGASSSATRTRPCMEHILIVDDSALTRGMMERMVRKLCPDLKEVRHASNGAEGLAALATATPNLVLLDLHMPILAGREMLTALRADPRWKSLPVIVLTSERSDDTENELLKLGASAYLQKPVIEERLVAVLAELSGRIGS